MADEMSTAACEKSTDKMSKTSEKIQRSVSSMIKQMELTEDEVKYRMENFENADTGKQYLKYLKYLKCTRCNLNFQNTINKGKEVGMHPLLGVLLCDSCCDYYGDGNFSLDSEGEDKYCRWCGQGGTIFACSKCICGFCEECIRKHFGKHNLEEVKNDDDWVCYFCNPRPLWYLRSICSLAKEAAKNKRESLEHSEEGRSSKMSRGGDVSSSNSSDSSWSANDSIKQKKVKLKPKRFSKNREKTKRDSSSSDEEILLSYSKTKRRNRKKSLGRKATDESSGSEARNPKKKARMTDDRSCDCNLETIKIPLLEKLKSLWKLTQSTTEEGLRRSRERLLNLSKPENFNSVESLKKELDELKSCTKELMSPLSVVSNSIDSIGEDLMIDTAKDEREIFQIQERKLKRFEEEEESNMEASFNSDRGAPSDAVDDKIKEKEGGKKKRKMRKKSDERSEGEGGDENGSGSRPQDEEGKDDSGKESMSVKPLLKVKSFAKMLDENVYDNKEISVNGNVSEKSPVVIDLLDVDSDGSDCESQEKKESVDGEKSKEESSEDGGRKSSSQRNTPAKKENLSRESKTTDDEDLKNEDEGNNSKEEEEEEEKEEKFDVEKKRKKKRKKEKKKKKKKSKKKTKKLEVKNKKELSESGSEASETVQEEAKKNDEDMDEKNDATSGEETQKEVPGVDKDCPSNDEAGKEDSEDTKEQEKTDQRSSSEKSPEKNGKANSSSSGDSSGGEEENRRITRNKKKDKPELKASFEMFKEVRKKFLESGKKRLNALDSSDSENDRKEKSGKQKKRVLASTDEEGEEHSVDQSSGKEKQKKRVLTSTDEEGEELTKGSEHSDEESDEKEEQKSDSDAKRPPSEETSSDEMNTRQVKRKRAQKKKSSDSSEDDTKRKKKKKKKNSEESSEDDSKEKKKGRKNIKKILKKDSLKLETKEALKNEEERKKRLKARQKLFEEVFPDQKDLTQLKHLVLDFDPTTKKPLVTVHKKLVRKLKPHQAMGVKFMWDNCFESIQRMEEDNGSGCILAHCMGLGKTLQVITLVHTVMTHDLGLNTVLIVCPLSTVSNWMREFETWLADIHTDPIMLYDLVKYRRLEERRFYLKDWQQSGGVLIMSYDLFRNLTKGLARKKKSQSQKVFESALLDPGPDLVICDEGHLLKNEDTALSKCMSRVRTSRRIVLTGTPLQNNLIEYHCMVQFVKPNVLGTKKEFCNRFVNPINNGQFEDSTELDVKIMKRRSHVLHSMLDGCIQRFDYSVLTPFLPEKHEYVLSIELTEKQAKAYRHFIGNLSARSAGSSRTASLFNDYHSLQRIWTHPRTMLMQSEKESLKEEIDSEGSLKDFVVSSDEESSSFKSDSSCSSGQKVAPRKRITRSNANDPEVLKAMEEEDLAAKKNWWDEFYDESAYDDLRESNKLVLLFDLLKHCEKVKDKLLVFSQSLYSLDLIEYFLGRISENRDKDNQQLCGHRDTWVLGSDYFRLDGSTNSEKRATWCSYFNKETNTRGRLFLLSTKAGGLGINLYGANRVVIFDASWNPSHDLQSIFRVYRFGQKKTCYVYRFLSEATMEEKIYERQVTKLSLAHRVVDEHQIERHYTMGNLQALYTFDPTPKEARKVPILPKDPVLADLLASHKELIVRYHEHDSLLENKQEEELSEEERKVAWKEYEEEKAQKTHILDPVAQQQMLLLLQQQARIAQGMYPQAGSAAQTIINPMYLQANPNIPLVVHQRGMKLGLTPGPNETLDSYLMRILNRESWLMSGAEQ